MEFGLGKVRNPYGNPGVGGAPYHRLDGGSISDQAFGNANAMLRQTVQSGLLGLGGFERAAQEASALLSGPSEPPKLKPSDMPVQTPWAAWSVRPYSDVRVVEY